MKRSRLLSLSVYYSLFTILLFTFNSCKQDFDITAEYKEVPVVYCLLNWQEQTHYIRIQKGYLIEGDASLAAGIPDSIYYPDILTVKLKTLPNGSTYTLNRIDGNNVGLPKDSGIFANTPNILYTFNGNLDPTKTYRLEITNNETGKLIYSETTLVENFRINTPVKAAKLHLQNESPARAVWNHAKNAGLYDLTVRFHYKEYSQSDNSLLKDTYIDILIFKSLPYEAEPGASVPPIDITSNNLLNFLAERLEKRDDVYREFNIQKGMQFMFAAGGTQMAVYMNSKSAQGGLASNEALPPYTNILPKGQALGILSSRLYKQVDSVLLSDRGLDSLACSSISRPLRFKDHTGQICN